MNIELSEEVSGQSEYRLEAATGAKGLAINKSTHRSRTEHTKIQRFVRYCYHEMNFSSGILTNGLPDGILGSGWPRSLLGIACATRRTQFLFPAFAAYIAWSADEIN